MKLFKTLFFVLFMLLIFCSQKSASGQDFTFRPKINIITGELKFKDLVEDYKYIKLETNANCLLGEIKQLQIYKSKIYIMTDGLYCFDINGRFLFAINNMGRGPKEILKLYNFSVDDDKIYLNTPKKIMSYNCTTGEFLRSYTLEYTAKHIYLDGNKLYMDILEGQVKETGRVFMSKLDDLKSMKAFLSEIKDKRSTPNPFTGYNKQIYYSDPLLVQVFKIHFDRVEKYIFFDFGKDTPSESNVESLISRNPRTYQGYSKAFQLENTYESTDFVVATVSLQSKFYSILFDKKSGKSIAWTASKSKYEAYQWFPDIFNAVYDDYFCMVLKGIYVNSRKASLIKGKIVLSANHPEYKNYDLVMRTDIMDNPIIALYKFKNLK